MASRIGNITFDCADPSRLAEFWAAALGYKQQDPPAGHATWPEFLAAQGIPEDQWNSANAVVDPDGRGPRLFFQRVPEPKTTKNRLHLDLSAADVEAEVERLVGLGAREVQRFDERGESWIVMHDPEGNEFCVQ
jgi:glyoxalase superfamily protein